MRWAALLRGINAGVKLPMADLRAFLADQGLGDVKTLLASGNATFTADETDGVALAERIAKAAEKQLDVKTDWFLRNHADLAAIIEHKPFPDAAKAHPNHLQVHFYHDPVPAALLAGFSHGGPERLSAVDRELYVDYPIDIGHSKLPQAMAKAKFPKASTGRNWNTVLKLEALLAG